MSAKCSNPTCDRISNVLCRGCKLGFCQEHLAEHNLSTHLQLNPLIDQINQLNLQLKGLNEERFFDSAYEKLEDWQEQSHQMTDDYFTEKTQEIDKYLKEKVKKYNEELNKLQTNVISYMREQETTHEQVHLLAFDIQNLQRDVAQMTQNHSQIHTNPLTIDTDLINFKQLFDLSTLPPVYRVIDRDDKSFTSLATNDRYLLLHHEGTLLLVDQELTSYKQILWTHGPIYDMCYTSALKRFIIINENEVFLLDYEKMEIKQVRAIPWQQLFSCTCSDTSLYLSTKVYSSSLLQFNFSPSIVFFKRWESSDICTKDEGIDGIVYKDNKLALMISNDFKKMIRLELRSAPTLDRLWSLRLDIVYNQNRAFRFCSLNYDDWLVADHNNSRLLHITSDGKMRGTCSYWPTPCCVIELGHRTLAVSTKTVVHLHRL